MRNRAMENVSLGTLMSFGGVRFMDAPPTAYKKSSWPTGDHERLTGHRLRNRSRRRTGRLTYMLPSFATRSAVRQL